MKHIIITLLIGLSLSISRVSVHDPSIVEDNGNYYVFGSHIATAKSTDLINWSAISRDYENPTGNVVYGNLVQTFKESFKWAGYDDGDCAGGKYAVWAPDVFYNKDYVWNDGSKGAWMLYYSASSTWRRSCIGFLFSKKLQVDINMEIQLFIQVLLIQEKLIMMEIVKEIQLGVMIIYI